MCITIFYIIFSINFSSTEIKTPPKRRFLEFSDIKAKTYAGYTILARKT